MFGVDEDDPIQAEPQPPEPNNKIRHPSNTALVTCIIILQTTYYLPRQVAALAAHFPTFVTTLQGNRGWILHSEEAPGRWRDWMSSSEETHMIETSYERSVPVSAWMSAALQSATGVRGNSDSESLLPKFNSSK
jgi:hypothetical protein